MRFRFFDAGGLQAGEECAIISSSARETDRDRGAGRKNEIRRMRI